MANVNIVIPDELHQQLRVKAALTKTTIKDIVIATLSAMVLEDSK